MGQQGDLGAVVQAELVRSLETCAFTVAMLMCSSAAISALVRPRAMATTISRSRGVSGASVAFARAYAGRPRRPGPSAGG